MDGLATPGPHGFDLAAASALPGPPWMRSRRLAAAERLRSIEQPTAADEDWRYSRIDELDLTRYAPIEVGQAVSAGRLLGYAEVAPLVAELEPLAGRVRSVDGVVVELDSSQAGSRIELTTASALDSAPGQLGELVAPHDDVFLTLSDAFGADVLVIDVPARVKVREPIVVVHEHRLGPVGFESSQRFPASFPRTLLRLGEQAEVTIIEMLVSGTGRRLVVPVTEVDLAAGARLSLLTVQQLGRDAWHVGYQASRLARDAELLSFSASLGGDYARLLTRCSLEGENASSRLWSVYLGDGTQMQDQRTFQEHVAPRTKSELVFKGAVADTARSVYTGLITMRKGARRADASQTNRNLVLSEGSHADSVPNLDIEENDVRCSHASAVGPIDPDLVFYLEARGVAPDAARRLVLLGFFSDLLSGLPVEPVGDWVREEVAARLTRAATEAQPDPDLVTDAGRSGPDAAGSGQVGQAAGSGQAGQAAGSGQAGKAGRGAAE